MKLDPFLAQRSDGWRQLSGLLDRLLKAGPARLTVADLQELGRLYRRAASDLAYARAHFHDPETVSYLNQLVARGHSAIYAPARPRWGAVWSFLGRGLPRQVRAAGAFFGVAALLLYGSVLAGLAVAIISPESASALVPAQLQPAVEQEAPAPAAHAEDLPSGVQALLGSVILTNNLRVGFLSFALGIICGAGTAYVLLQNGLMLGALAGKLGIGGSALDFWSLIAPHGGLELLAITLCGAGGLLLGWALVSPGDLRRRDALIAAGRKAVPLVVGAIPLFGIAALIEAFVTPAPVTPWGKVVLGIASTAAVLAYLGLAGRGPEPREGV
jgi:uncharacterized membrane protein SpoIIM required for sporulation